MSETSEKIITLLIGAVLGSLITGFSTYYVAKKTSHRQEICNMFVEGQKIAKSNYIMDEKAMINYFRTVIESKYNDLPALIIPVLEEYINQYNGRNENSGVINEAKELLKLAQEKLKK